MSVSKEEFIKKYVEAIKNDKAAIFAGAGLSYPSGYVDWKGLLKPFAESLGLDIEKETNYITLAQYYLNEKGNRKTVSKEIFDAFSKTAGHNENISILSSLPIRTYWTTNYDHLIEDGLRKKNKKVDVKISLSNLSNIMLDSDVIVYKMHGDVNFPENAVLTKEDYVQYDQKRPFFKSFLQNDLISKTFLFIGFGFEDPNLDNALNQIHLSMKNEMQTHYCFFKIIDKRKKNDNKRLELKVKDLMKYGIQTVFINDYSEITDILLQIKKEIKRKSVFISGSADQYDTWSEGEAQRLAYKLAHRLVEKKCKITSGFGFGIGSSVINGALDEIYNKKMFPTDKYLCLRPFPQNIKDDAKKQKLYTSYREDMIADTGVAVFLFGNKKAKSKHKKIINAPGCREEFEIAKRNGNIIIPIGSTGYMAKEIFDEIKSNLSLYPYLNEYMDILEKEKNIDILVNTIIEVIESR